MNQKRLSRSLQPLCPHCNSRDHQRKSSYLCAMNPKSPFFTKNFTSPIVSTLTNTSTGLRITPKNAITTTTPDTNIATTAVLKTSVAATATTITSTIS